MGKHIKVQIISIKLGFVGVYLLIVSSIRLEIDIRFTYSNIPIDKASVEYAKPFHEFIMSSNIEGVR